MNNQNIQFYLVRDGSIGALDDDFDKILAYLGTYDDLLALNRDGNGKVTISYKDSPMTATLATYSDPKDNDTAFSQQMTLTCDIRDNTSINLVKSVATNIGYRIFNPITGGFVASDPNLVDLTTSTLEAQVFAVFKARNLIPIYQYKNSLVFYAKNPKDNSIHLVNRHLLQAMLHDKKDILSADNFSTEIAPDIVTFIALADRGLIPNTFYHTIYRKSKGKVMHFNLSGFDLDRINENVYLAPVVFHLDRTRQSFVSIGHLKTISVDEKIKKGESVKKWVGSLVDKHKINPLIAVKYPQDISFKVDESKLVPRISMSIFVDNQN